MIALMAVLGITVVGGVVFALASGFVNTEKERAQLRASESHAPTGEAAGGSHANCVVCSALTDQNELDEVVAQLEMRVRMETLAVSDFLAQPSMETLYDYRHYRDGRGHRPIAARNN